MWLTWLFAVLLAILMPHYLTKNIPKLNVSSTSFGIYGIGMCVIPVLICGGFRLWLARMHNPWLALLPFFIGTFFAWQAGLYGIFLFPDCFVIFQILGWILLLVYLPLFVELRPAKLNGS